MITHKLSLSVVPSNDTKVLRLIDNSLYAAGVNVDCGTLEITPPGFSGPISIDVTPYFNSAITTTTLGFTNGDSYNNFAPLKDGIYIIRYSVGPNDKVWVEYNHLRTEAIKKDYYSELCSVGLDDCNNIDSEKKKKMDKLSEIKMYIDAAIAKVEYCKSPNEGIELLGYARKQLNILSSKEGCTTC